MRFDSYHPAIQLLYFAEVITFTAVFRHPVFLAIFCLVGIIFSVKLSDVRAAVFDGCLLPLIALFTLLYAYYHYFGVTDIGRMVIGNAFTRESLIYGCIIGVLTALSFANSGRMEIPKAKKGVECIGIAVKCKLR